ncbi:MAG: CRISPR-associated endonuclease Cas2 [Comamonadaceae bacterium]|nr:CRISPR-associated endonuclease Cas2 [Comamonadaceae bacterium]
MSDYIICYDIANPRRLGRIHRVLKKHALAVQYSVFLFSGTEAQLQRCLAQLQALMDERYDDIRAYPLPQRGLRLVMGASALPEGILLGSLSADWQGTPL